MTGQPAARGAAGRAIRAYWPMIYAPTAMYSMGQGALIPVLPKIAAHHAAGLAPEALLPAAALVAAMIPVGQLCGNLPAGVFIARFGERAAMIVAAGISLVGIAVMLLAPNIAVLGLGALLIGTCASVFALARHAFMTTRAPLAFRARALALIGGSFRLGTFTGPLMAAGLIAMTGSETSTLWFFGACLVAMGLLVAFGPDPETRAAADDRARRARERSMELEDTGEPVTGSIPAAGRHGLFATIRRHRGVLARLGLSAASMAAVRAGRQAILPLWGLAIGLESWQISLIVGFAGAAEFSLFYASGQVMDRFGRIWATVPSQLMMGLLLLCLALTHNAGSAEIAFAVCAIIIGIGNGLSSGALMTLGSDQAPQDDPAPFLGGVAHDDGRRGVGHSPARRRDHRDRVASRGHRRHRRHWPRRCARLHAVGAAILAEQVARRAGCPKRDETVTSFATLKSLISRGSSDGEDWCDSSVSVPRSDNRGPVVTPIGTAVTPFPAEDLQQMIAAYKAGASLYTIACEWKLGKQTVRRKLDEAGVRIRRKGLDDEQVVRAVSGYESGQTIREVAADLGVGHSMVWRALKKAGVELRDNVRRVGRKLSSQ